MLSKLDALTTRHDDDFSIALIDAAACAGEILTFYTERLSQEAYLRTALDRFSLAELGKLVGYRLRPGVAALTHLAFHVEPGPPPAVDAATSPFHKVRMPGAVTIPAGTPVRSVPGPGEQSQVFETAEAIQARPEWNLMRAVATKPAQLGVGSTAMHFSGILKPGDVVLFYGDNSRWEIRPIATVDGQRVTWRDPLSKAGPLTPFAMRKRLQFFGANAPMWKSMSTEFKKNYGCETCTEWPSFLSSPLGMTSDMDGTHPDITVGGKFVFVEGTSADLFTAQAVSELSRSQFALSGKVTRVRLSGGNYSHYDQRVRETTVYAVSEELILAGEPDTAPIQGGQITLQGNVANLPPGRTLLIGDEMAIVKSAVHSAGATTVVLQGDLARQHSRDTPVFGNVAVATHGVTVHQILGDGQAARPFQRFELKHEPLTYLPGGASTLEVRVNDVVWQEVPSLYKQDGRVYATRGNEVRFGDGKQGARVSTGQHNVRAKYRKGIGVAGNLPKGALTQLGAPPLGVTGVTNPVPALGGTDPDSVAHARRGVPLSTRTLGRAVSLLDYADFARTYPGIAKAHAHVNASRTIVVTVAGADGAFVPDSTRALLTTALRQYGDPLAPVLVVPHLPVAFRLRMKVRGDATAVRLALLEAFGFEAREFGRPVHRSEVIAAAHRPASTIAVDLDQLYRGFYPSNQPRLLANGPSELLLLPSLPPSWIVEMP